MAVENRTEVSSSLWTRYLIVRPENGGIVDLVKFLVWDDEESASKFLQTGSRRVREEEEGRVGDGDGEKRWVIVVSIIVRKIIAHLGKPLEWTGDVVDFLLNLLSLNGNFTGLFLNLLHAKVVIPKRGSENFISTIGHIDGRIDLCKSADLVEGSTDFAYRPNGVQEIGHQALMDLCIMASKLAYENANVVKNVVHHHWQMHFVDFYNCWNDYQKQRSTQVFIMCDKQTDANFILISFRGTEPFDADDWITDFDYSWYEIPKLGKVHVGFLEALGLGNRADAGTFRRSLQRKDTKFSSFENAEQSEWNRSFESEESDSVDTERPPNMAEMTAYYSVRMKLRSLLEEHRNAKFIVTGHSLGGALAILFPVVLVLHEEKRIMERMLGVYTFGQPRVGDDQLRRFMEEHVEHPAPKYFRVVYCNDLVPRLPYDDETFLYKHFGVCLFYNSWYIEQNVDEEPNPNFFGLRYLIPAHLNAAWELFRSLIIGYIHGPEYKETWCSILLRMVGLAFPGVSAHSPTDYVNSVRLGSEQPIYMSSI